MHCNERAGRARPVSIRPLAASMPVALWMAAACCLPGEALAQFRSEVGLEPGAARAPSGWDVTLGLGVAAAPRYPGDDRYGPWALPMVMVRYQDLLFIGPGGIGLNLLNWNGLRAGPIIGAQYRRHESDDPQHLTGLGNIPLSATAGGFVTYGRGPVEITALARQAVTHTQNGLTGRLALSYRQPLSGKWLLRMGPELDFGSKEYEQTWFGVTPSQSVNSGLPAYTPHGGLRDVGFNASLTYRYSEHVLLHTLADFRQYTGDAANSPIVHSKSAVLAGFGAAYHF